MKSKARFKGDFILIIVVVVLGLSALAYNYLYVPRGAVGTRVVIEVKGQIVYEFDLTEDLAPFRIETEHGYNVVEIVDGQVRVAEANCPDLLCVHTGWRKHVSQVIVCLPHYFVVRIVGDSDSQGDLDGFTY